MKALKSYGLGLALFLAIAAILLGGLSSTAESSREEQRRMLSDSIRRAMVTCYAVEGSYPESMAHMIENYGVRLDGGKFIVHYRPFASNIMPDFDILDR